jgi:exodeoxyribonuclease VII large subunit
MFRGNAQYLKFRLEVGTKIVISGNLTVYAPRGNYQLLCQKIEPSGVGALALAYEQLKAKLQIKGYFDKSIKKELLAYPKTIYIITSNTGAAIEDMKKILNQRYPIAKMVLLTTLVQGDGAKEHIVRNIKKADNLAQNSDIIIVGRGGGSIEDLWAFNEEIVADAIFEAKNIIISAVGHESDFVISDFVADVRASTPSNAIEISTPNINDLRQYTDNISDHFNLKFKSIISTKEQTLKHIINSFEQHSLNKKFELVSMNIDQLKHQFNNLYSQIIKVKKERLSILQSSFNVNHPKNKDKNGFVQISKNNQVVNISDLNVNDLVSLENSEFKLDCKIIKKNYII